MAILRKSLNLDFTQMAKQLGVLNDPLVQCTRATGGTRINPLTGNVEYVGANVARISGRQELWNAATRNVFEYSNDFSAWSHSNCGWSKAGAIQRLDISNEGYYTYSYLRNLLPNQLYTVSFTARCLSGTRQVLVACYRDNPNTGIGQLYANLTTTAQRFTFLINTLDTISYIVISGGGASPAIELGELQIEAGGNATTYQPNPYVIEAGLLNEPAATNYFPDSQNNSLWSGMLNVTNNTDIAPDGTQTADTLNFTAANQEHYRYAFGQASTMGSVWLKGTEGETLAFNGNIITLSSQWRRFFAPNRPDGGNSYITIGTYYGVTARTVKVWGGQGEDKPFPTTYIPTNGAITSRASEVLSVDVSKFWNTEEGTLIAQSCIAPLAATNYQAFCYLDTPGTDLEVYLLRNQDGTDRIHYYGGGAYRAYLSATNISNLMSNRFATTYNLGRYASSTNGRALQSNSSAMVVQAKRMAIGSDAGGGNSAFGTIQQVTYIPYAVDDNTLKSSSVVK